jgi:V-type H+-transporting ATPase subunit d
MKPEDIRTSLKKMWLEDFYDFCSELNPTTSELMRDLLKFEADFKWIQIVYNTIGNKELNTAAKISNKRKALSPSFGNLYPDCEKSLLGSNSLDTLREAVKGIENYKDILKDAPDPTKKEEINNQAKTLDDIMYEEEARRYALAFD